MSLGIPRCLCTYEENPQCTALSEDCAPKLCQTVHPMQGAFVGRSLIWVEEAPRFHHVASRSCFGASAGFCLVGLVNLRLLEPNWAIYSTSFVLARGCLLLSNASTLRWLSYWAFGLKEIWRSPWLLAYVFGLTSMWPCRLLAEDAWHSDSERKPCRCCEWRDGHGASDLTIWAHGSRHQQLEFNAGMAGDASAFRKCSPVHLVRLFWYLSCALAQQQRAVPAQPPMHGHTMQAGWRIGGRRVSNGQKVATVPI